MESNGSKTTVTREILQDWKKNDSSLDNMLKFVKSTYDNLKEDTAFYVYNYWRHSGKDKIVVVNLDNIDENDVITSKECINKEDGTVFILLPNNISEEFRMSVIYHYMNKTEQERGIAFSGYHWDMIDNGQQYHIDWNNSVDIEMFERFWS